MHRARPSGEGKGFVSFIYGVLVLAMVVGQAHAGGVRIIQNPSFEIRADGSAVTFPPNAGLNNNTTWAYWGDSTCGLGSTFGCIAGWRTTDAKNGTAGQPTYSGPYIEVAQGTTYGLGGQDAYRIVAELNATQQSRLWQPVCLQAGEPVTMTYYFSPRSGVGVQQVAAGLWDLNDQGPIGGAMSYQNSNPSSTVGFTPQIAYFTAPSTGNFQMGLEALLPATGSNGNIIDDVKVVLKPLIDLNTNPNFTIPEGGAGPALQLRINGTVQSNTVVAIRLVSGTAIPDTDFSLGTPTGLAGTTPTMSHTAGSNLWLVTVPAGEYDAGQGIYGNTKYGISIPINATYDTLREGLEDIIFQLQAPSIDGSDPVSKWDRTNPICEGATTNTVTYDIDEIEPKIRINKIVNGRIAVADQFVTQVKDGAGAVVSSTSASATAGGGVVTTGTGTTFNATGSFQGGFNTTYTLTEAMAPGSTNTLNAYTSTISCTNARTVGTPTTLPSGSGQSFAITVIDSDDITCTITNAPKPVVTLNKALGSTRSVATDQFAVQIKNGAAVVNNTANSTTTGSGATITAGTGTTGVTALDGGVTYTLTEIGAGTPVASLPAYNSVIACTNTNAASTTVLPSGRGQSFSLTPQGNDNISCTLTNVAHEPRVTVLKSLNNAGRYIAADQFTMEIRRTSDNALINATTNSTTLGSGSAITAGSGTTDPTFLVAGTAYTLREVGASGATLSNYTSSISCTNGNSGSATVLPTGTGTSFSITPNTDDNVVCTLSNLRPRIRVNKTVVGLVNTADRFTTEIRTGGAGGTIVSSTATPNTTTGAGGGGVLTNSSSLTTFTATDYFRGVLGTAYTITESVAGSASTTASYQQSISCTNANTSSTTVLPSGVNTSFALTPLSANDDIDCTISNTPKASLTLVKTITTGRNAAGDQFTLQITGGSTSASTTTTGSGTTVTGGSVTASVNPNQSYTLQEVASGTTNLANYYVTYSCTNATGGSTTTMPSGFGASFTVTPAASDNITCTINNRPGGRIRVNKVVSSLVDVNDRFTTQVRDDAATGKPVVSSTSSNTRTGGGVLTTGGVGTYNAPGTYTAISGRSVLIDEVISAGTSGSDQYTTSINCVNTSTSATVLSSSTPPFTFNAVGGAEVACTLTNARKNPQITLNKTIAGVIDNVAPVDQFKTQIFNGATLVSDGAAANGTVTTTNTSGTTFPATYSATAAYTPTVGNTYTLTEAKTAGSTALTTYSTFINCTNTRSSGPVTLLPTGAGQSFSITPLYGDNIACTMTNGPARLRVTKALANARRADSDEFTLQIRNSGGTVLNSTIASTTAGDGNQVISGTGDTSDTYVAGGVAYNLREIAASGSLDNYETRISCTNAASGSATVLPSTSFAANSNTTPLQYAITPVTGDDIDCVITNRHVAPVASLTKVLAGVGRQADTDEFLMEIRQGTSSGTLRASGTTVGTGNVITAGTGVAGPINLTAATSHTFQEVSSGGTTLSDYSTTTSCIDTNASVTPATSSTSNFSGSSFTLTPVNYHSYDCTMTNSPLPRIRIYKELVSKVAAGDTFTTQVKNAANTTVLSGTTTNVRTGGGVSTSTIGTTATTGFYQGVGGTTYTLTEVISGSTTTLSQYNSSISCTNDNSSSATVLPGGAGQTFSLTPQNGDRITCTISNTPKPLLRVGKVVSTAANAADRFTTQIRTGSISGTVVSDTTSSTVTGGGVLTTSSTGTFTAPGALQAAAGTTYYLTEILSAGTSSLNQYDATLNCTNANASSTTILPQTADSAPYSITVQDGDNITCTYTNTAKAPKVRVNKTASSLVDASDRFTSEVRTGGVAGTVVSGTSGSATTGGGVFTTGGAGTYTATGIYAGTAGTAYTVTESLSGGTSALSQYNTSISCSNAFVGSSTVLPAGSTQPFTFTPQAGDDITCTLTNSIKQPLLRVGKTVSTIANAADRFTTQIRTGGVSGTVVSGTTNNATTGGGVLTTGGVATYNAPGSYQATIGTTYTFTEAITAGPSPIAFYSTTMSCSNTRSTGPATTLPSGATAPFDVVPRAGDDITCTLTNTKKLPLLRVNKVVSTLVDANDRFTTEVRTGGVGGTVVSTTASNATTGGGVLTTGGAGTYNATGIYQGIEGTAYTLTESISGGTSSTQQYTTSVSCTNTYGASTTVLPTGTTAPFNITPQLADDITCTLTNSIKQPLVRVHKTVAALVDANDRFTTQVRTGGVNGTVVSTTTNNATTGGGVLTTGGAATYNAPGSYQSTIGTAYTITEALSGGTSLANQYTTSLICTNARTTGPATTLPSGTAQPFNFTPRAGDDISCTLTNTPIAPVIRVNKVVSSVVAASDAFTTQIRTGGVSGTVVSSTSSSTTTGGGVVSTAGTTGTYNASGSYQAVAGTTYTLTEILSAGTSNIGQYSASLSCTNSRSGATTTLPSGSTAPFNLTPVAGDDISCSFTNAARPATVKVQKTTLGGFGGPFSFTQTNLASAPANITTVTVNTATPASPTAINVSTIGTAVTLTETVPANWLLTAATCSDANSAITGNPASFGSLSGNVLTIPAGNIVAGADISCNFTNRKTAQLTLHKSWVNAKVNDAVSITSSGGTNNPSLNSVANAATETDDATAMTVFAGETLTFAENFTTGLVGNYNSSIACTGATDGNASDGLTINAADSAIDCTYTNSRKSATLTLVKAWVNAFNGETATVTSSGFTNNATTGLSTSTGNNTTTGTAVTVFAGESGTISEVLSNAGNYNATLACTGNATALTGNALTIDPADTAITCTYTNTRKAANLRLAKTWVGAQLNDTASLSSSGFFNSASLNSTADTANETDTGSTVAIFVGETGTLSEVLGAANDGVYSASAWNCSGGSFVGNNLTVNPADDGTTITCTLTNTIVLPKVRVNKVLSSYVSANDVVTTEIRTGGVSGTVVSNTSNSATLGGGAATTAGTTGTYNATGSYQGAIGTVYTLTESISGSSTLANQYNTTISCSNAYASSATVLPTTYAGSADITPRSGDDITCTLTNSVKQPVLRVNKTVNSLVSTSDRFTTEIRTGGVSGTVVSSTSVSATTGGGVETTGGAATYNAPGSYQAAAGTTYTFTEVLSAGPSSLSQYNTTLSCTNARTGATTVLPSGSGQPFNVTPEAGDDITCTMSNTAATNHTITGKVFTDNGLNTATPHNGVQESDEVGISNVTVTLTDCAATTYQSVVTAGDGSYSLTIPPALIAGTTLCVEEHQAPAAISVSGVAGTTGGSYNLAADRTQFTLAAATSYTGVNFGDVSDSQLTGVGSQSIPVGATATYAHQFIASTEGAVTFGAVQAPNPAIPGWTSTLYLDNNCDSLQDGGDTLISGPVNVMAGQTLCLLQKVQSPLSGGSNGAQDNSTITASFALAAPSAIVLSYSQVDHTVLGDDSLLLTKTVREVMSCPSTAADTNPFGTTNTAKPNAYIEYRIHYSNPSTTTVSDIVVHDMTPAFTTFGSARCISTPASLTCDVPSAVSGTAPAVGGTGNITWTLHDNPTGLAPGQSGEVSFCVHINP